MSGHRKFSELRDAFLNDPERGAERRKKMQELDRAYDALLALYELREAMGTTQGEVAEHMGVSQPYVSKLEARGEMSLTTLARYLSAIGGRLEVRAVFPEHPEQNVALALPRQANSWEVGSGE